MNGWFFAPKSGVYISDRRMECGAAEQNPAGLALKEIFGGDA